MNIVIPMAGAGSRFQQAGYETPKPFLPVGNRTMIDTVVQNFATADSKIYLQPCFEHIGNFIETGLLGMPNVIIKPLLKRPNGAAIALLAFRSWIDNDEPLLIVNSDQYVSFDKTWFYDFCGKHDATILTFPSDSPAHSYALVDAVGRVVRVAEKEVISNKATVGAYYFKHGSMFVNAVDEMVRRKAKVRGEYYVCPVFNVLLETFSDVECFNVDEMYMMGDPISYEANKDAVARLVWE